MRSLIAKALEAPTYADAADILDDEIFPSINERVDLIARILCLKRYLGAGEEAYLNLYDNRTLNASDTHPASRAIRDLEVFGAPDQWKLIAKASSQSQGWMRSTKAMEVPGGCIVQVSTIQDGVPAEAITFIPRVKVRLADSPDGGYEFYE